jgi:hypothetical protein
MKKTLLLITFAFGLSYSAFAGACADTTLATYEGAGFSCSIGDLTFSSFSSTGIDTTNTVDTVMGTESGLQFAVDLAAPSSPSVTAAIGYTVTCDMCTMDDWELQTGGAASSDNGGVSVVEFSTPGVLTQFTEGPSNVTTGTGSATFSPAESSLIVNTNIALGGGNPDTVTTLESVTNLFSITASTSTVPEPSTLILCAGVLGLLPFARRRFAR